MKFTITGSAGQISKPLAMQLLGAGHHVAIIGRNRDNLEALKKAGATILIGSLEDADFLCTAFAGADAVYTMCPPNYITQDLKGFYETLGRNYVKAINQNRITYVVNLSSIGAHLAQGAGPVSAMHQTEELLNTLKDVNIKHLRPAYFYHNLMFAIDMIKNSGIVGNNFSNSDKQFPVSDPADIAAAAAEELIRSNFSGHSVRYIASDETDTEEIAMAMGKAIGKPDLKWLKFNDAQAFSGLLEMGVPRETAAGLIELGKAIDSGKMLEDYRMHRPAKLGSVKLEDFMTVFSSTYKAN